MGGYTNINQPHDHKFFLDQHPPLKSIILREENIHRCLTKPDMIAFGKDIEGPSGGSIQVISDHSIQINFRINQRLKMDSLKITTIFTSYSFDKSTFEGEQL